MKCINKQKRTINLIFTIIPIVALVIGIALLIVYAPELQSIPMDDLRSTCIAFAIGSAVVLCYYCLLWRSVYRFHTDERHRTGYVIIDLLSIFCAVLELIGYVCLCPAPYFEDVFGLFAAFLFVPIVIVRLVCFAVYKVIDLRKTSAAKQG